MKVQKNSKQNMYRRTDNNEDVRDKVKYIYTVNEWVSIQYG